MAKAHKKVKTTRRYNLPAPGLSPGTVYIDKDALTPVITLYSYNREKNTVIKLKDLSDIKERTKDQHFTYWLDIKGLNSTQVFEVIEQEFGIEKLVLEDITRTYQRPKLEENKDYVFAISRMLHFKPDENTLVNEQVSFILKKELLITFEESYFDCFEPIKNRLDAGQGNIRISGPSYLMYALMDGIVDTYFHLLNSWGEVLDEIEDRLLDKPKKSVMFETQEIKRKLITIRRIAWPERDKLNDILRSETGLITDHTRAYVKDAYDHCIQIIDIIESLKEIAANNIDMYLSVISNRMNEIMKVLTIISSIFIPLTFIAGIYGMNFAKQDPVTGKVMPQNMPELYQEHGYLYTMIVMGVIALVQVYYFWRKGWFK